ncbi:cell division protein FtsQ/DivIB [Luteimonas sp. SDU82]|uniref:cell division protein FtsQ/DivIB n=1 Tax=Luteimonas sp. SDU82 TaxID=3422592 RepID=UPI003EBE85B3
MNAALRRGLQVGTWAIAIALVALPVVAVLNGWIGAERWPLRTLRVNDGLERVDAARLRETLLPYATSGFFAVKLDHARAAIAQLPWVEHAEVRKRWPDVLEVRIVEHRPFARWGEDRLLSEQGRLFPVAGIDVPEGLPQLSAADARVPDVVALYNESREMFAPGGHAVARLALDSRDSWSLTLDNGVEVVVGSQEARLRLKRFARVLPQLLARSPQALERADLRYTNGFALTWGEAVEPSVSPTNSGSST